MIISKYYITFVFISVLYFLYQNREIGLMFLIGNLLWVVLIYYVWPVLRERNINYENNSLVIEQHLVENLNNVDKIVSRGKIDYETSIFDKLDLIKFILFFKIISSSDLSSTLALSVIKNENTSAISSDGIDLEYSVKKPSVFL